MATTNVQKFAGDVDISSNLAVNTNDLFVDTESGRVGIGTTSPNSALSVTGDRATSSPASAGIHMGTAGTGGTQFSTIQLNADDRAQIDFSTPGTDAAGRITYSTINDSMYFQTNGTDNRLYINSDGNVGIGTNNPLLKLQVNGTEGIFSVDPDSTTGVVKIGNFSSSQDTLTVGSSGNIVIASDTNANNTGKVIDFRTDSDSYDGTLLMRLKDNGNVGIGTDNPGALLELSSATGSSTITPTKMRISSTTDASDWNITDDWGTVSFYATDGSGAGPGDVAAIGARAVGAVGGTAALTFRTKAGDGSPLAEHMCILDDGKVGIGTDNPTHQFHASASLSSTSDSSGVGIRLDTSTVGYNSQTYRQYYNYHRMGQAQSNASIRQFNGNTMDVAFYNNPGNRWMWRINHSSQARWQASYQNTSRGYFEANGANNQLTFTGQHRSFIDSIPYKSANVYEGRIVSADKNRYTMLSGNVVTGNQAITINEAVPVVSLTEKEKDKNVFGVISLSEDPNERKENYGNFFSVFDKEEGDTRVHINSLGEGSIWVCNKNGNLESGDYITSSTLKGYGQKQDDDLLHNYTVAKITMDCDFNPVTQPIKKIKKKPGQIKKWVRIKREEINYETYSKTDESKRDIETKTVYIDENNNEISKEQYDKLNSEIQTNYTETTKTVYIFVEKEEEKEETEGFELEVTDGMVNDLDENDQIQWEDTEETEKAYNIRFLDTLGEITDEANSVYIGAFVGCTYHCG